MNYRDSQQRKTHAIRINQSSNVKCGSAAIPSKKPPIPYCLLQCTHKKENNTHNKQNKMSRQSNQTSIWVDNDKSAKGRFCGITKGSVQRASHGKLQQHKIKKIKKDPYNCNKNSKEVKVKKNEYKYYRQPKSILQVEHSQSIQRIRRTQWNVQVQEKQKVKKGFDLNCRERIKKNKVKKHLTSDKSETVSNLYMSSQTLAKTTAQEIAQFKQKTQLIQIQTESQAITQIALKQNEQYRLDINKIQKQQPNIPWIKRAIVINWMMETLSDFGSKRETFAISTRLLDHYLALSESIPLEELQTVAVTSMYLANKLQDHIFGVRNICEFTGNDSDKILQYELRMVTKLKWKLNPPTANMWANRLSIQWDQYIDKFSMQSELIHENKNKVKFWAQDTQGYYNYRELMQFIDFSILQINTLRYHCRDLAASFMYIILNIRLKIYEKEEVLEKFPCTSTYLIGSTELNMYFNEFLQNSFGFYLKDLLPAVQYCSTFLILPPCYKLPNAVEGQDQQQITYSQFCSFQTCNQNNLTYLGKRDRTYE